MSPDMSLAVRMLSESAALLGLVPLAWLVWLTVRRQSRDIAYWWLAVAFSVSWVADTAALAIDPFWVSLLYPVTQAAIIGAVFLTRKDAAWFVGVLVLTGAFAVWLYRPNEPDILLHTVGMLGVAGIVVDRWALGTMRTSLLVYFGLGWCFWIAYSMMPGWWTWGGYQLTRASGIVLWCYAVATHTRPSLSVERGPA